MEKIALLIKNLNVAYDSDLVLEDLSFSIPQGRLAAIIGPNGAGKSTLIKAAMGLIKPLGGEISFPALSAKTPKPRRLIAYVPQNGSIDRDFPVSVMDVVLMGRYGSLGLVRRPAKADVEICRRALAEMGMEEYAKRQIGKLSGGQLQRVFLARALAQKPELYIMDEPFKGVDTRTEEAIYQLMQALRQQGKTLVVVHHDLQSVEEKFDWVTILSRRLVANGPCNQVLTAENIQRAYGQGN